MKDKMVDIEQIKLMSVDFGEFLKKVKGCPDELRDATSFLDDAYKNVHLYQRAYHIWNDNLQLLLCPFCNKPLQLYKRIEKNKIYIATCGSISCKNKIRESTCMEIYGSKNVSQSPTIQSKKEATCIKNYGVPHPLQSGSIRNQYKLTCVKKYGVENPSQVDEVKLSKIQTSMDHYGVKSPNTVESVKEKKRETSRHNYGVDYPLQSVSYRESMKLNNLQIHGVEHPSTLLKFRLKQKKTTFTKYGNEYYFSSDIGKEVLKNVWRKKSLEIVPDFESRGYKFISYKNREFTLKCPTCNQEFTANKFFLWQRMNKYNVEICPHCNPIDGGLSWKEEELKVFIESLGVEIEQGNRTILDGKEIDIYIPSKKIGFEFNGLYWHSDAYKEKMYHHKKKILAIERGVNLIHIWEDDWNYKNEIVKSRIRAVLGMSTRIYARKCVISEVDSKTSRAFLDQNHIQGHVNSKYKIGLYFEDKLVTLATFGIRNKKMELLRYVNILNHTVVGGFSRLLKHFIKTYSVESIFSYADLDWSMPRDNVYETNGFEFVGNTDPGYFWVVDGIREYRQKYMKHKLIQEGFDSSKTETEIMHDRGYNKIYNSGNAKYSLNIKKG